MNMKVGFLAAVVIAVIALTVVLGLLAIFDLPAVPLTGSEVSSFNLLIDIAVGVFTVWGLYWAASELALKPELNLIIEKSGSSDEVNALIGRDSRIRAVLFLENTQPKAARYVQIVLRVRDVPRPERFRGSYLYRGIESDFFPQSEDCLSFQFGGDFVVYKGGMVYSGDIEVDWPQGTRPEKITFIAELHSLEGEPKEVTVSYPIHWLPWIV